MDIKDVPKNQWLRLGYGKKQNPYGYERWMFVTNIIYGNARFHLDVSRNDNHPNLEGNNSFLQDPGFWIHQEKDKIYVMDPPEKNRIQRECIISIWENLDE